MPGPASVMHMQQPSNATVPSTEHHMPDAVQRGVTLSPELEPAPEMEPEFMDDIGNGAQQELLWETQEESLADNRTSCAMDGLSNNMASSQTTPFSSDSAFAVGETRKVSLFLEDMEADTANAVTSILLQSNVDLKMKMTVP